MEEAIQAMTDRKAVGPDGLPVGFLGVLDGKRDPGKRLCYLSPSMWRGAPQQETKDATTKALHKKKDGTLSCHLPRGARL